MSSLYDILGCPRTASPDEIKIAYKFAARRTHPDAGGTAEAFAEVSRAYEILSDPDLRAHYDATGEAAGPGPERHPDAQAWELIAAQIQYVIASDVIGMGNDLSAVMRDQIGQEIARIRQECHKANRLLARAERLEGRFKLRGEGENRIEGMIGFHIRRLTEAIDNLKREISVRERAVEILQDYDFEKDAPPAQLSRYSIYSPFNNATAI